MRPKDDIFTSIFPSKSLSHSVPTPLATPNIGFTDHGDGFGGVQSPIQGKSQDQAQLQVRRNLAWSTATRFLSLEGRPLLERRKAKHDHAHTPDAVQKAITLLANPHHTYEDGYDLVRSMSNDWLLAADRE